VVVGFVHFLEKLLNNVVFLDRIKQQIGTSEEEAAIVVKRSLIVRYTHLDLVL
jgi:hypothetical protein